MQSVAIFIKNRFLPLERVRNEKVEAKKFIFLIASSKPNIRLNKKQGPAIFARLHVPGINK